MSTTGVIVRRMARNASYYDGDLRSDLLRVAIRHIESDGAASISIRALAKELGVSHAAPANHFKDKRALFTAIAIEGFELLGDAFVSSIADLGDGPAPLDVLRAGGRAYIGFALEHPGSFDVMWRSELLEQGHGALDASADATFAFLEQCVVDAQAAGWRPEGDARALALHAWSAVHGFAVLWLQGPLPSMIDGDRSALIDQVVESVLGGEVAVPLFEHRDGLG